MFEYGIRFLPGADLFGRSRGLGHSLKSHWSLCYRSLLLGG